MPAFMLELRWLQPQYLYLLPLALPPMAALLYLSYRQRRIARQDWGEEELIERFTISMSPRRELAKALLCLAAIALAVIAVAMPVFSSAPLVVKEGSTAVRVDDTLRALADLARASFQNRSLPALIVSRSGAFLAAGAAAVAEATFTPSAVVESLQKLVKGVLLSAEGYRAPELLREVCSAVFLRLEIKERSKEEKLDAVVVFDDLFHLHRR